MCTVQTLKQTHKHVTEANSLDKHHTAIMFCPLVLSKQKNKKKSTAVSCLLSPLHDEVLVPACSNFALCGHLILYDQREVIHCYQSGLALPDSICISSQTKLWVVVGVDLPRNTRSIHVEHTEAVVLFLLSIQYIELECLLLSFNVIFAILFVVDFKSDFIQSESPLHPPHPGV